MLSEKFEYVNVRGLQIVCQHLSHINTFFGIEHFLTLLKYHYCSTIRSKLLVIIAEHYFSVLCFEIIIQTFLSIMKIKILGYSFKNIPIPPKKQYLKSMVEKVESFIKRLHWEMHFFK